MRTVLNILGKVWLTILVITIPAALLSSVFLHDSEEYSWVAGALIAPAFLTACVIILVILGYFLSLIWSADDDNNYP